MLTRPPVYPAGLCDPAVSGGENVVRLSLGKLLVDLLPVSVISSSSATYNYCRWPPLRDHCASGQSGPLCIDVPD